MSRRTLIVGNWKMHLTASQAAVYATQLRIALEANREALARSVEVALAPAFPALERLGRALEGSSVALAAQNVHAEPAGAFTGEVSVSMLEDLGCRYVLIGHSERRQKFGELDAEVAAKALRLLDSRIDPILCIGETLEEREQAATFEVVGAQLEAVLDAAGDGLAGRLVVAYEPIWAIGTGRTATPEIAQQVHASIREVLGARLGEAGQQTRILYGGSVKPSNARELLAQPDIDGALVGGASLKAEAFAAIVFSSLENP
jgi:triosephosphate isomerase